ncbi:MAG: CDP-alcohol phosphatidyltransferase family protein [Fusobacteriaceae bacterium]
MLDTNFRKYVQPFIQLIAVFFIKINVSANTVTKISLILGIGSSILIFYDFNILAILLLWLSGLLDAVDGSIARLTKSTPFGTVMDITFDRIVELSIIVSLTLKFPQSSIYMVFLTASIVISMTIFLTTGLMSQKTSEKSFYYQAGLMERSEAFILFSLMIYFQNYLSLLTIIFTLLILFTSVQRFIEARNILNKE